MTADAEEQDADEDDDEKGEEHEADEGAYEDEEEAVTARYTTLPIKRCART